MLSPRIRTIIITLVAATAVSASAVPMAGAQMNNKVDDKTCEQWQHWYNEDIDRASKAALRGDRAGYEKAVAEAANDLKLAKDGECGWPSTAQAVPKMPPAKFSLAPVLTSAPAVLKLGAA